jgi:predicted metal-dependent hydrolase
VGLYTRGDKMIHTHLGQTISFEIKYKKRTSMSIHIDSNGYVEVHVPKGISDERVILALEEMGLDSAKT